LNLAKGIDAKAAETAALALDSVQHRLAGKAPKKVVVVPDRIVNVVA
jgi:leucyl-tRNA synthetase